MIIVATTNKYTKKIKNEKKIKAIEFFINNPDVWFKSEYLIMEFNHASIRTLISSIRNSGVPIISDTRKGYKFTTNRIEINECYEALRLRALKAITAAKMMKKIIN